MRAGFVDILIDLSNGIFGERGGHAALAEVPEHARAAEFLVGQARGGETLGIAAVVEVAVFLEAREDVVHIGGAFGAATQFLAQFAGGMRTSAEDFQ